MNTTKMRDEMSRFRNEARENLANVIKKELDYLNDCKGHVESRNLLLRSKAIETLIKTYKEI